MLSSCLILLILFLLNAYYHLHQHSFPTRRSSDLSSALVHHRLFFRFDGGHQSALFYALRNSRALLEKFRRDRKSTRLNSSHVAISYAVFCLKKKTISALGIVLVRYRGVEQRHHLIADELLDRTSAPLELVLAPRVVGAYQRSDVLRLEWLRT